MCDHSWHLWQKCDQICFAKKTNNNTERVTEVTYSKLWHFVTFTNVTNGHTLNVIGTNPVSISIWNLDQNDFDCPKRSTKNTLVNPIYNKWTQSVTVRLNTARSTLDPNSKAFFTAEFSRTGTSLDLIVFSGRPSNLVKNVFWMQKKTNQALRLQKWSPQEFSRRFVFRERDCGQVTRKVTVHKYST